MRGVIVRTRVCTATHDPWDAEDLRRQLGLSPTRRQLNPKQLARALARAQRRSWRRRTRTTRLERMLADVRRKPFPGLPLAAAKDIHRKSREIVESMDKRSMDTRTMGTRTMLGVSSVPSSNVTSGIASKDTPSGATSGLQSGMTNTTTVASNEPSSGIDSTSTGSGSDSTSTVSGSDSTSTGSGSDGRDDDTRSVSNTTEAPRPTDTQTSPATSSAGAGAADARGTWPEEGSRPLTPAQLREKRLLRYVRLPSNFAMDSMPTYPLGARQPCTTCTGLQKKVRPSTRVED